jgi:hypothetical protein
MGKMPMPKFWVDGHTSVYLDKRHTDREIFEEIAKEMGDLAELWYMQGEPVMLGINALRILENKREDLIGKILGILGRRYDTRRFEEELRKRVEKARSILGVGPLGREGGKEVLGP